MKKILFIATLLIVHSINAQIDLSSTRFGLTIGGNYSRVSNAHNPSGPRFTLQAGVLALIPIDQYDQFYLQPEVVYYGAGETGKDKNAKGKPGYNAIYANNYISVPVYFKGYFSEAESEFYGIIGPRFNFLVNQKVSQPSKPHYTVAGLDYVDTDGETYNVNGKASGFAVAIGAGIGYSYKRQLELALKYDFGITNTYKGLMREPGTDPNIQKRKTEQVLSVSLSYIFE